MIKETYILPQIDGKEAQRKKKKKLKNPHIKESGTITDCRHFVAVSKLLQIILI